MHDFVRILSARFLRKWFFLFAQSLACCTATILFLKWAAKKRIPQISKSKLPSLKTPFYSLYGHFRTFPPASVMKKMSLSLHACLLQTLSAHAAIFQKHPLFRMYGGLKSGVILTRQESVEGLLSSNIFLEKASVYNLAHGWLGTGLLTSHGSKWKSRRKLFTQSFHSDILKNFMPAFHEQSKILVDILKTKTQENWIDIVKPMTLCSLDIICETMLGVHVGAQTNSDSKYVAAVLGISEVLTERVVTPILHPDIIFRFSKLGRQFKRHCQSIHSFTRKVIQEKKQILESKASQFQEVTSEENSSQFKRRRKALMDLLLDVHLNNKEGFTEEDIKEEVNNFVFAGHDTTAMAMSWALYLIGLHPDVQRKIHQELAQIFGDDQERPVILEDLKEMQYLERVIKESLRLYPPVSVFGRKLCEDFSVCGYTIKRGTDCAVYSYWLHRNPEAFPNPERFDPDRFLLENSVLRNPFAYVPFSAGSRNCIGQRFAMMEEKVVISNILRHFHVESLETRDKIFPVFDIILRSSGPLKLKLSPHTPN